MITGLDCSKREFNKSMKECVVHQWGSTRIARWNLDVQTVNTSDRKPRTTAVFYDCGLSGMISLIAIDTA